MADVNVRYITYLIYIILWQGMIFSGTGYIVFAMGESGWWFVLAIALGSSSYKPQSWIDRVVEQSND